MSSNQFKLVDKELPMTPVENVPENEPDSPIPAQISRRESIRLAIECAEEERNRRISQEHAVDEFERLQRTIRLKLVTFLEEQERTRRIESDVARSRFSHCQNVLQQRIREYTATQASQEQEPMADKGPQTVHLPHYSTPTSSPTESSNTQRSSQQLLKRADSSADSAESYDGSEENDELPFEFATTHNTRNNIPKSKTLPVQLKRKSRRTESACSQQLDDVCLHRRNQSSLIFN